MAGDPAEEVLGRELCVVDGELAALTPQGDEPAKVLVRLGRTVRPHRARQLGKAPDLAEAQPERGDGGGADHRVERGASYLREGFADGDRHVAERRVRLGHA